MVPSTNSSAISRSGTTSRDADLPGDAARKVKSKVIEGAAKLLAERKRAGGLIRPRDGPVILSPKVPNMLTSPIKPSLDPSLRVLSLPLTALYEAPVPIGALAGLPAGSLDIASATGGVNFAPCFTYAHA